ncbi:hypothetical protein C5167_023854 [Papaver somniferum]|uniref:Protein PRD1 n=1 Tax=Papaver somniferum TaxID=3469 RepID=A0A4Y7JQQ5_PAPSO|nr:hypothetical protein C5167_023854 [Papaver somniferum]
MILKRRREGIRRGNPYIYTYSNREEEEDLIEEEFDSVENEDDDRSNNSCSQGHRSSLRIETKQGGSVCILCFVNLISSPNSPLIHISYALSQLSQAISSSTVFLNKLLSFHIHLIINPLTSVLSNFDDEPVANQTIDLISVLCKSDYAGGGGGGGDSVDDDGGEGYRSVSREFIVRISDFLSSGSLAWSRRQIYMLHCFGVLLSNQKNDLSVHVKDRGALISNLVNGLQLPSEEIRGEILFVLFKVFLLQAGDDPEDLLVYCPKLLSLSLEALMKTQSDEVRTNCIALLTVLAQRGYFESAFANDNTWRSSGEEDNFMQATGPTADYNTMTNLFAEAIKGPLLSSDTQVQIGTLDLIFHCLSREGHNTSSAAILVEENIADYVFEILRLSGYKDPAVISCLRVLGLLSVAENQFNQRLVIGFSTLVPVLHYVSEVPFHPVQSHTLKLIWTCISNSPGTVSSSQLEELALLLTGMFKRHTNGDMGMLPETFTLACSIFGSILQCPSSEGITTLLATAKEATRNAILSCLCEHQKHPNHLLLYALYLLKETHAFSSEERDDVSNSAESMSCTIDLCENHLLPWLRRVLDDVEEEDVILGILETFHMILLQGSDQQATKFTEVLASSAWFSLSYGCMGLFPTEKMKCRVYLMLSSVVDWAFGDESGQPIRDAAPHLPSDPQDLLFLLGQKSGHDLDLLSCQSAVLLILYTASLYDERLADEKQVLASLEQYILVNQSNFLSGVVNSMIWIQFINLYALYRGKAKTSYQVPYSPEAEKLVFYLIDKEWDLLSSKIHPVAVKWLFQQEKVTAPMLSQILNFSRLTCPYGAHITVPGNQNGKVDVNFFAELVAAEDNFAARLLVSLLTQLQKEECQVENTTSVLNLMVLIINISPDASDQLCVHGIGHALHSLCCISSYNSSHEIFFTCALLIFNILRTVKPELLSDHEIWLLLTTKLLEVLIPTLAEGTCKQEGLLVIGILSQVLHLSTMEAFKEASLAILVNTPLISAVDNIIYTACSKGPALVDHDESTGIGETLIFVLLLYLCSLKSMHALPEGTLGWKSNLEPSGAAMPLHMICIQCHDLCRLLHFGTPLVKLLASNCLLELLSRISDQRSKTCDELNCSNKYLKSVMAVLEGLVFDNDVRVAINCGLCLSTILGWGKPRVIEDSKWCRLIVEELALSLAAPSLASKLFTNQHKAASHVAVALLRLDPVPRWMRSVFNCSCISGIVKNLSANNVTEEMVQLFRALLISDYLKTEQIDGLNNVFQACRQHDYTQCSEEIITENHSEMVVAVPDDLDKVRRLLIRLISSDTSTSEISRGVQSRNRRLLDEIEMFFQDASRRE